MRIPFSKYHGLGNDFILFDALAHPDLARLHLVRLAPFLCNRHEGVGADGILLLGADPGLFMRIINADGSDGGMCGNGLRCVALHLLENHDTPSTTIRIAGRAIRVEATPTDAGANVRVHMGRADSVGPRPFSPSLEAACESTSPGWRLRCGSTEVPVHVSIGNPHLVIPVARVEEVPLHHLGPLIERHPDFPDGVNVHFAQVHGPNAVRMATWERGAGPTRACGSGACAAALAAISWGWLTGLAHVHLPGGVLDITVSPDADVVMKGPAVRVFDAVVTVDV